MNGTTPDRIGRLAFLTALGLDANLATTAPAAAAVRFALVTVLHDADKPPAGDRQYPEALANLAQTTVRFRTADPPFEADLGDLLDTADSPGPS